MGTVQIYRHPLCYFGSSISDLCPLYMTLESVNVHKLVASLCTRPVVYAPLAADTELLDKLEVCLTVMTGNVLQVALALSNELQ